MAQHALHQWRALRSIEAAELHGHRRQQRPEQLDVASAQEAQARHRCLGRIAAADQRRAQTERQREAQPELEHVAAR